MKRVKKINIGNSDLTEIDPLVFKIETKFTKKNRNFSAFEKTVMPDEGTGIYGITLTFCGA